MISFWCFFKHVYLFAFDSAGWVFVAGSRLSGGSEQGYSQVACLGFSLGWLLVAERGLWGVLGLQRLWPLGSVFVARGLERRCSSSGDGAAPWRV